MRRWLSFDVAGASCAATLDEGPETTGLLIVSGGNEVRAGSHRGMANLARAVAAQGFPVLRYDRRGIGDSEGVNRGFEASGPDIAAAAAAFRSACPHLTRLVAFGNCDAAAALMLHPDAAACDRMLLANPWTIDEDDEAGDEAAALPPAAAIRARYKEKLTNPREWLRLITGGVNLVKLAKGLAKLRSAGAPSAGTTLVERLSAATRACPLPPGAILIAERDGTARAFMASWREGSFDHITRRPDIGLASCATSSHGFADEPARIWLETQVLAALRAASAIEADT